MRAFLILVRKRGFSRVFETVVDHCLVKSGDVMPSSGAEFEEELDQQVFNKPNSSNYTIRENGASLDLDKSGGVV